VCRNARGGRGGEGRKREERKGKDKGGKERVAPPPIEFPGYATVHPAYQFVCIIISNHNILSVTAVHECQEFDKCFNSY
jgi:hypothetical protein